MGRFYKVETAERGYEMLSSDELLKSLNERERDELEQRALREAVRKKLDRMIGVLKERYEALADKKEFKEGDLVCWKPGMRNRKRPAEREPVIVVEVLEEPVYDEEKNAGSPTFREPLDLVLGLVDEDGDLLTFHFDSRRFQILEEQPNSDQSGGE